MKPRWSLAQGYLDALCFGVPGAYAYHALKQMSEGVGRTVPIMVVMAIALPVNVLLNFTFMFGHHGGAPLGAVGCGLGNGIAFWLMFLMLAAHVLTAPAYRPFMLRRGWEWPRPAILAELAALGVPIGLSLCLQAGLFTVAALMTGTLGTIEVAAHQVVLNYSGLVFMLPLGFAMALTVCVGQAAGRGDFAVAGAVGRAGIALCGAVAAVAGGVTFVAAPHIAAIYAGDAAVAALAATLFRIAAVLQFCDGVQVAAAFALRGLKDTRVPLLLNSVSYWGIGFVLAWWLGLEHGLGTTGIWIGLSTALGVAGVLLVARFWRLSGMLALNRAELSP